MVAGLREAALRAVCLREKAARPDGARPDINPHTPGNTTCSLASMLTFDSRGGRRPGSLGRIVHTVSAGHPERIEPRRRRLGRTEAARLLSDVAVEEAVRYTGPRDVPARTRGMTGRVGYGR
ncbi:hypothetical protein [Streptomyces sp. XY431]|uniref:hypothetical protein n=1 Tax=Streptomyces sp. XY431 TaxID=1415562 RepID=UPI0013318B11|nr:hypothetical protein [Streptomyces sp. XY431]